MSRQYRQLHSAEVPADLDRLVLRQAGDAVKSRPAQGRPAWVRWTAPLAVAASAVLVLSIVIEMGVRDETAMLDAPQPTMQAKERQRAENKAEETTASESAAPAAGSGISSDVATEQQFAEPRAPRNVPPAEPPPPELDMPSPREFRSAEPVIEAPKAIVENYSSPPPVAAPAAPPPAPATIMPTRSISRAAEDAARVLQGSSLEESARKQSAAADEAHREEERSAAQMAYSRQISAPLPEQPQVYTDPEAWLKDIRQLRKENRQEQADREWRRFRAAFPKYEVAETDVAREAKQ